MFGVFRKTLFCGQFVSLGTEDYEVIFERENLEESLEYSGKGEERKFPIHLKFYYGAPGL